MRRRPFHRRLGPGAFSRRGPKLNPVAQAVREAHLLALTGQPDLAAARFEELAAAAAERGGPHAPQLYLQAGRFHAQAGELDNARSALTSGFQLLASSAPAGVLRRVTVRLAKTFLGYGQTSLSQFVVELGNSLLPSDREVSGPSPVQPESGLPAKCPYCGASVDPRDVEWLQDKTAMCEYCGSMLEA